MPFHSTVPPAIGNAGRETSIKPLMVACLFHTAKIAISAMSTLVLFCSNSGGTTAAVSLQNRECAASIGSKDFSHCFLRPLTMVCVMYVCTVGPVFSNLMKSFTGHPWKNKKRKTAGNAKFAGSDYLQWQKHYSLNTQTRFLSP